MIHSRPDLSNNPLHVANGRWGATPNPSFYDVSAGAKYGQSLGYAVRARNPSI